MPEEEAFLDTFQDKLSSTMGKNMDQAFHAQDDLVWDEDEELNQKEKEDEQRKEVTFQPPPIPQESNPLNEKPNI